MKKPALEELKDPSNRDLGPREVEVHLVNRSLCLYITPELKRLGVRREDIVRVRYEAPRFDAMGRRLTPKRIIIEAIE